MAKNPFFIKIAVAFSLAVFWRAFDFYCVETFLITPIDNSTFWMAGICGAVVGIGFATAGMEDMRRYGPKTRDLSRSLAILGIIVGLGAFGAFFAQAAVWRVANAYLFWGSDAEIERTMFPITEVFSARGRPSVLLNTKGERELLQISHRDFQLLGGPGRLEKPWSYCLSLLHQKEADAVRVWRPDRLDAGYDGKTIVACPDSFRGID